MYYLFLKQNGSWLEWGKSESFSNCEDAARSVTFDKTVTALKITGPEGEWYKSEAGRRYEFTATK